LIVGLTALLLGQTDPSSEAERDKTALVVRPTEQTLFLSFHQINKFN